MALEKTVRDIKYDVLKSHELDIPQRINHTDLIKYWSKEIVIVPGLLPNTKEFRNTVKRLKEKENIQDKKKSTTEIKKFGTWLFNKSNYRINGETKKLEYSNLIDAVDFAAKKENQTEQKSIIIVPSRFYIDTEKRNEMEKNVNNYHKLNTHKPLESMLKTYLKKHTSDEIIETIKKSSIVNNFLRNPTAQLSQELINILNITPEKLAKQIGYFYNDSGKLGYSFKTVNSENRQNFTVSWINLYKAQIMGKKGIFEVDKHKESISKEKIYANAKDVLVHNRQNNMQYEVTFTNLPLAEKGDESGIIKTWQLNFSSHSPDSRFKGEFHKKQKEGLMYATKHIIFAYNFLAKKYATYNNEGTVLNWNNNPFLVPNANYNQFVENAMNMLVVSASNPLNVEIKPSNEALINLVLNEKIINTGIKKLIL